MRYEYQGRLVRGAGGASMAALHNGGARLDEYESVLGFRPYPGTLNLMLDRNFRWDEPCLRVVTLDVERRKQGPNTPWVPKPASVYRVDVGGHDAVIFRHDNERYRLNFVEVLAPIRLRDVIVGSTVTVIQCA